MMGNSKSDINVYNINKISVDIGTELCKGLPFFHAFTGCDTVSSMFENSKVSFWDILKIQTNKQELFNVFQELSNEPKEVNEYHIDVLERFVLNVY